MYGINAITHIGLTFLRPVSNVEFCVHRIQFTFRFDHNHSAACRTKTQWFSALIIYKEMFLGCDWLIRVQLIQNITQNSAKICNTVQKSVTTVQKSVTTVQKSVTTVQKSVTTVQKSVISSLSDGIYSLKNQKYGARIFTFA